MDPIVKKIFIGIAIVLLVLLLVFIIAKTTKKDTPKKEEQKQQEQQQPGGDDTNPPEIDDDDDIPLPQDDIVKVVQCTYEGEEHNVVWEKSTTTFHLDKDNQVIIEEDVREYKFEQVNIEEYINNQTLDVISKVLNGVKGIQSTLSTIDQEDHTYRFTTIYDFRELDKEQLYNFYYKRFYNTDDIYISKERFDEMYKSQDYDYMVKTFLRSGYVCNNEA